MNRCHLNLTLFIYLFKHMFDWAKKNDNKWNGRWLISYGTHTHTQFVLDRNKWNCEIQQQHQNELSWACVWSKWYTCNFEVEKTQKHIEITTFQAPRQTVDDYEIHTSATSIKSKTITKTTDYLSFQVKSWCFDSSAAVCSTSHMSYYNQNNQFFRRLKMGNF